MKTALCECGIVAKTKVEVKYTLKESFRASDFYRFGVVFANKRVPKAPECATGLPQSLRDREVSLRFKPRRAAVGAMLGDGKAIEAAGETWIHAFALADAMPDFFSILLKASREFPALRFDRLKERWPSLVSMREFLTGPEWCGSIRVCVESGREQLGAEEALDGCRAALALVAEYVARLRESWEGSYEFTDKPIREVFTDKTRLLSEITDQGEGMSQNDPALAADLRFDLSDKDWYAYNDNFGTSEEKAFVRFFAQNILPEYEKAYEDIRLVRNERQMPLFSFVGGERFEPDFVLFLRRRKGEEWETRQIFVEPKGTHLLRADAWKEDFLCKIKVQAIAKPRWRTSADTILVGLPFFNRDERIRPFEEAARNAGIPSQEAETGNETDVVYDPYEGAMAATGDKVDGV